MNELKNISVIIPVKNEGKKIEQCLEAVFKQTIRPLEVIVVDGHSKDDTVKKAQKYPVKICFEEYHTRAGACEVGIENSTGNFIAFTDADCLVNSNWLENLMKEFGEGIVGVGGGIENMGEDIWGKSINFAVGTFLGSARSVQGRIFKEKRYVRSISGCNSMYRKTDLLNVGGFDTGLPTAEDAEINNKLSKIGKLVYTPDAIVLHNHNRGIIEFAKRMQQYGYGRAKSKLLDLQVLPPFFFFILLISLLITPWILITMSSIYFLILVIMGIRFTIKASDLRYLFSIPLVYLAIHGAYTLGLGKGLLR